MIINIAKFSGKIRNTIIPKEEITNKFLRIKTNYQKREKTQELSFCEDNLEGTHYHLNYLNYLETAWDNHYGVVITPDIIWHTLLSEVVQIVSADPEKYASLFTTTPDKKKMLIVITENLVVMPLDLLIKEIKKHIPTDISLFMPEFTTTTDRSRMVRYASFADLVSPYYNYGMLACGIPYVDVLGTKEDWDKVLSSWKGLSELFPDFTVYFDEVTTILNKIQTVDTEFWKDMFRLEKCGSGSQTEVFGWFADLFRIVPSMRFSYNFPTHVAKVCYKQLNTDQDYEMYSGLFSSKVENDCLVPDFGYMVFNKLKEDRKSVV